MRSTEISAVLPNIPDTLKHDYYLPLEIINLPNIRGSRLEEEAEILQDALESRTNGMFDRESHTLLNKIKTDSPLYAWKKLILALSGLYETDWKALKKEMDLIPRDSGPALLLDVLAALAGFPGGKEKRGQFSKSEKKLYNLVAEDRRFVKSAALQLLDTLEAGEEYFHEFALLTIREIREMDEETGRRLALWCLGRFYIEDFDYNSFLNSLKQLFSKAQVMRFSALILSPDDSEEGIKCWLLSLLYRIREGNLTREEAAEYLWIVSRLAETPLPGDDPGEEFLSGETEEEIRQVLSLLHRELSTWFKTALSPVTREKQVFHFPAVWAVILAPLVKPRLFKEFREPEGARQPQAQPLQLELFGTGEQEITEERAPLPRELPPSFPPEDKGRQALDLTRDTTACGLLSPRPLESPLEMKELIKARPRYVGPEPWLEVIRQKRKSLLNR